MTAERLALDGGMGAALMAAGLTHPALPEEWLLSRPEAVGAVHAAHAAAGAGLILSCTFNLAGPRLDDRGLGRRIPEIAAAALRVARQAAPGARVAGAVGPTALVDRGSRSRPSFAALRERYREPFAALTAAGADLLWTESHGDLEEARAALAAARESGLPAVATLGPTLEGGRLSLPDGPSLEEALLALWADGAAAVGVNCVLPGADLAALSRRMAGVVAIPFVVKPSAGLPGSTLAPGRWAAWVAEAARAGARWTGGCCGAGPDHLAALRAALAGAT